MTIKPVALATALALAPAVAPAATVFESGAVVGDMTTGLLSDVDYNLGGSETVYKFTLDAGATLRSASWAGGYFGTFTGTDDFILRIYADYSDVPDTSPLGTRTVDLVSRTFAGGAFDYYVYTGDFADIALASGTYWLSFVNDTSDDSNVNWSIAANGAATAAETEAAFRFRPTMGSGPWFNSRTGEAAVQLFDEASATPAANVPLPAAAGLLAAAAAGLGLMGVRRRG